MARTKAVLGAGSRLSDFLSASLLARVYPSELVQQVLDEHKVNSQRVRSLPAVATAYYCIALSLYPEAAYEDVFAVVAQGLAWMQGNQAVPTVAKSSISAARSKIGCAPLQVLHQRACVPLAQRRRTLRSKTPDGVRQEFYGWVLAHYAVCWLMHQAASAHRLQQRSLSFTSHVHLLRRAQPRSGAFPPSAPPIAATLVRRPAARGRYTAKHE